MWLTTELGEWAVTKLNMIHFRFRSYSQSCVAQFKWTVQYHFINSWNCRKKRKELWCVYVKNRIKKVKSACKFAFGEQTSWSLVSLNVTSRWEAGSNTLPQRTGERPGVRRHVPVSRVSVCLCDCFNIGFLSVVAWCSSPVVRRHREAWGTLEAMERDPFHPPLFIKKEQHRPVLCCGPLVQRTRDNQMIPLYTAY